MVRPEEHRDKAEPWLVMKADSGDVVIHAMCVPKGATRSLPKKGQTVRMDTKAVVEVVRKPQAPTESPASEWRAWIAWRGHARMVTLDVSSVCSGCGRLIVDAAVSPDGLILIEH